MLILLTLLTFTGSLLFGPLFFWPPVAVAVALGAAAGKRATAYRPSVRAEQQYNQSLHPRRLAGRHLSAQEVHPAWR